MARLIDLEAAIEAAKESDVVTGSAVWYTGEVVEFLEDQPTVDAVEVVHGHWIETEEGTICSECHEYPFSDGYFAIANYNGDWCPNCGAKMDGGTNGKA